MYGWKDLLKVEYNCPHKYPWKMRRFSVNVQKIMSCDFFEQNLSKKLTRSKVIVALSDVEPKMFITEPKSRITIFYNSLILDKSEMILK